MDYRMYVCEKKHKKEEYILFFREIDFTKKLVITKITNRSPLRPDYVVRHLVDVGHYAYSLHYVDGDEILRLH